MLEIAVNAAQKAGERILSLQGAVDGEIKNDGSPVTEADRQASTIITDALNTTKIPILNEETYEQEYEPRENLWVVDPLDGTKEFIKGKDEYTVNIAYVEEGTVLYGVIFVPAKRILYYGGVTTPSVKVKDETERRIFVDPSVSVGMGSASHPDERVSSLYDDIGIARLKSAGSSLKGCYVAEGKASIYARFHSLWEWDVCAMQGVIEGAGGVMVPIQGGRLRYGKDVPRSQPFIAAAGPELISNH